MHIDKAIEILEHGAKYWKDAACPGTAAACSLGVEALKRIKMQRAQRQVYAPNPLPGETAEMPASLTDPTIHLGKRKGDK